LSKRKVEVQNCSPCGMLRRKVVFVEWEDDRYFHGYFLNDKGKVYVEVAKEDCEEFEG
jgi:hypothetical protein